MGVLLAGEYDGFIGFARFPDVHARHFAPIAGPMVLVLVAPIGLVARRVPRLAAGLAMGVVVASVGVGAAWRSPEPGTHVHPRGLEIPQNIPAQSIDLMVHRLLRPARSKAWRPPVPSVADVPLPEVMHAIAQDAGDAETVLVLSSDALLESAGLLVAARTEGLHHVHALSPARPEAVVETLAQDTPPALYGLQLVRALKRRQHEGHEPTWNGFMSQTAWEEVARFPMSWPEERGDGELMLLRWPAGTAAAPVETRQRPPGFHEGGGAPAQGPGAGPGAGPGGPPPR
jgi:hypothetical protein